MKLEPQPSQMSGGKSMIFTGHHFDCSVNIGISGRNLNKIRKGKLGDHSPPPPVGEVGEL